MPAWFTLTADDEENAMFLKISDCTFIYGQEVRNAHEQVTCELEVHLEKSRELRTFYLYKSSIARNRAINKG